MLVSNHSFFLGRRFFIASIVLIVIIGAAAYFCLYFLPFDHIIWHVPAQAVSYSHSRTPDEIFQFWFRISNPRESYDDANLSSFFQLVSSVSREQGMVRFEDGSWIFFVRLLRGININERLFASSGKFETQYNGITILRLISPFQNNNNLLYYSEIGKNMLILSPSLSSLQSSLDAYKMRAQRILIWNGLKFQIHALLNTFYVHCFSVSKNIFFSDFVFPASFENKEAVITVKKYKDVWKWKISKGIFHFPKIFSQSNSMLSVEFIPQNVDVFVSGIIPSQFFSEINTSCILPQCILSSLNLRGSVIGRNREYGFIGDNVSQSEFTISAVKENIKDYLNHRYPSLQPINLQDQTFLYELLAGEATKEQEVMIQDARFTQFFVSNHESDDFYLGIFQGRILFFSDRAFLEDSLNVIQGKTPHFSISSNYCQTTSSQTLFLNNAFFPSLSLLREKASLIGISGENEYLEGCIY